MEIEIRVPCWNLSLPDFLAEYWKIWRSLLLKSEHMVRIIAKWHGNPDPMFDGVSYHQTRGLPFPSLIVDLRLNSNDRRYGNPQVWLDLLEEYGYVEE